MKKNGIEIVVHVDEELGAGRRYRIVESLQGHQGISDAHFTPNRPHLMIVDYDPAELHAVDVLNCVRNQHVTAELVGGL